MKIYEIDEEIADILNPSDDEAAIPPDDENFIPPDDADNIPPEYRDFDPRVLDGLEIDIDRQLKNYIAAIKNLRSAKDAFATEIRRLQAKKWAIEKKEKRLSDYVKGIMERLGRRNVNFDIHTARIAKSPPSVEVLDESVIRDEFIQIERTVKKQGILDWHKETGEIPEGTDIVVRTHLRIS